MSTAEFQCSFCGAYLARCSQCGVAGEPVGHIECPVAARKAGQVPLAGYHVCSIHHGQPMSAPAPTHTGPKTIHVLFEGHVLCGFMAGCVPSGWPDGHAWVSIVDMLKQKEWAAGFAPCPRCLSLASAASLSRSRA